MSLANLLKKGSLRGFATATAATVKSSPPPSVASVATVAVAKAPDSAANDDAAPWLVAVAPGTPPDVQARMRAASLALDQVREAEHKACIQVTNCEVSSPVTTKTQGYEPHGYDEVPGETAVRKELVRTAVRRETSSLAAESRQREEVELQVSGEQVSALVSVKTATSEDLDRWAWPHSTAMNGAEIDSFTARLARFTDRGLSLSDSEALADRLLARDRDGDGRRTCTECHHLAGHTASRWHCNNWRATGVAIRPPASLPADLVWQLQRCDGFDGYHEQRQ